MSKNYRLVEYFVSEFYLNRPEDLEHIVSPDFIFKSRNRGANNFAQYVEIIRTSMEFTQIKIKKISSNDDVGFLVDFAVQTKQDTGSYGKEAPYKAKITVEDDLIKFAEVDVEITEAEIIKFNGGIGA
ncbi:MAG: hypothetical protein COB13_004570 [OCS116 cluster bacterium]|nr:hypothetical protein [OCS116 cluster bacterium]